jgi:hypothetical protein
MAGIRRLPSGLYQCWYQDWTGKRKFFTHNRNPKESQKLADDLESKHNKIMVGDLPPPKSSDAPRTYKEVAAEYLLWGEAQGGHGGRPWSDVHLDMHTPPYRILAATIEP